MFEDAHFEEIASICRAERDDGAIRTRFPDFFGFLLAEFQKNL
jgi:hypothetical protein